MHKGMALSMYVHVCPSVGFPLGFSWGWSLGVPSYICPYIEFAVNSISMKRFQRLEKFVERIGRYGDKFIKTPEKAPKNKWIVNEIRTILDQRMSEHSSKPELTQHFNELFCGLDKITTHNKTNSKDPLDPSNSEEDIIDAFDRMYFRGESTFKFTSKMLADPRVKNIEHFSKAVAQGGTILRRWTVQQREMFQLHVANKLWISNRRNDAAAKMASDYHSFWRDHLLNMNAQTQLSKQELRRLCVALIATKAVPVQDLLSNAQSNWRSIFVLWQSLVQTKAHFNEEIDVDDEHLWHALTHIYPGSDEPSSPLTKLPNSLSFVPTSPSGAEQQIRSGLLRYAQQERDGKLLDLLQASSGGKDTSVEVGIVAARLFIA